MVQHQASTFRPRVLPVCINLSVECVITLRSRTASISFPPEVYETLEMIAKEKKVSLAWVVREAAEQYIGDKWPLFSRKAGEQQ